MGLNIGSLLGGKKKKKDDEDDDSDTEGADDRDLYLSADKKKKWNLGDYARLKVDGMGDVVVPRGDMSDEDWDKFLKKASEGKQLQNIVQQENNAERDPETQKRTYVGRRSFEDRPKSDYMEITLHGEKAVLPKGDIPDKDWDELKKKAKDQGIFSLSNETLPPPKAGSAAGAGKDLTKAGYAGEVEEPAAGAARGAKKAVLSKGAKAEDPDANMEDLETQSSIEGEGPRGIRGFVQRGLMGATPEEGSQEKAERVAARTEKGAQAPLDRAEQIMSDPTAGLSMPQRAGKAIGEGVRNAISPKGPDGNSLPSQIPGVEMGKQIIKGAKMLPDIAQSAGEFVGAALNPDDVKGMGSTMVPPPGQQPPGDIPDMTGLPARKGADTGDATPISGPAPTAQAMKSPSAQGAVAAQANPEPDYAGQINEAYKNAATAQMATADLESQGLKQKAELFDKGIEEQVRQQSRIAEIQQRVAKEREAPMKIYNQMLTELMHPTKEIDPHRWWNSRTTGQKIMLALGAAFTKGGSLQMVENAINADIAAQQADITNNQTRKKMALGAADNMIQMIRQNGADDVQAAQIAKAMSWDLVSKRAEMIAANTDSQTVKQKATQTVAEANVKRTETLAQLDKYSQQLGIQKEHNRIGWYNAETARMKALTKGSSSKDQKLKGPQVTKIATLQDALAKMEAMEAEFRKVNGGWGSSAVNTVTKHLPRTGASRFDFDTESNIAKIGDSLGNAGVMQKADVERFKSIHPQSNDPDGLYKLQSMKRDIQRRLAKEISAFKAAGFDTGTLSDGSESRGPSSFVPDEGEEE